MSSLIFPFSGVLVSSFQAESIADLKDFFAFNFCMLHLASATVTIQLMGSQLYTLEIR